MQALFNRILDKLEEELAPDDFHRWLMPSRIASWTDEVLYIQVPNIFFKNWINEKYLSRMSSYAAELAARPLKVEIVTQQKDKTKDEAPSPRETVNPAPASGLDLQIPGKSLNVKYRFSNFVVGSSNQLAHAASKAVAYGGATYNPLFIYGGSGLGKTHLLHAIGNHLMENDQSLRVVYMSSEDFTNELIEALRSEGMVSFRQKHRNIDTLLIDDIHFIGGRERTQEEFFYTFNALHESNKQIVLTSDKMPKEISDLEDRLRSRFEGGLFADITPPDRETKVAILSSKAEEEGITLSNDVAFYLASQNETNIRVLEGYLARLGAYSSLTNNPIDLESAQKLLGLFIEAEQRQITLDLIFKVTSEFFNIKIGEIKSAKKQKAVATPRQAAMYMARRLTSLSTIEIGQRFGGRDHSTVIHAVKKVESRIADDHSFAKTIADLEKAIRRDAVQSSSN